MFTSFSPRKALAWPLTREYFPVCPYKNKRGMLEVRVPTKIYNYCTPLPNPHVWSLPIWLIDLSLQKKPQPVAYCFIKHVVSKRPIPFCNIYLGIFIYFRPNIYLTLNFMLQLTKSNPIPILDLTSLLVIAFI